MAIYPRIKDSEREQIPEKDRCQVTYNGYHNLELVRETPASTPVLICTKCQKVIVIQFPKTPIDKVENYS